MHRNNNVHRCRFPNLADGGASVFVTNIQGETLLHVTAKHQRDRGLLMDNCPEEILDSFKLLMELGLDPMAEDNSQRTAVISLST